MLLRLAAIISGFLTTSASSAIPAGLPAGVHSYEDRMFISAAPTEKTFQEMAEAGVQLAVDLREPQEMQGFERKAAEKNKIDFFSAPLNKAGDFQKSQIDAIDRIHRENPTKKIWVYCQSGNRAAAWFAIHLAMTHHQPINSAIAGARKFGLTRDDMAAKVRSYLLAEKRE